MKLFLLIVSFLFVSNLYSKIDTIGTKKKLKNHIVYLTKKELNGRYPQTDGSKIAREYIEKELKDIGVDYFEIYQSSPVIPMPKNGWFPKFPANNIISRISAPNNVDNKCVVFSAHYDHGHSDTSIFLPGAADNAAGVSVLIELARSIKKNFKSLDTDFYFTFPDMEEIWINGSPGMARHLKKNLCKNVLVNINLDVIGGPFFTGLENQLLEITGGLSEGHNTLLADSSINKLTVHQSNVYLIEPFGSMVPRSDYSSFRKQGIPFIFYTSGTPWYYHTKADTEDRIDYNYLTNIYKRVLEVVSPFKGTAPALDFKYNKKEKIDYNKDAKNFAAILKSYINNPFENKLKSEDIEKFKAHITLFEKENENIGKMKIQKAVIDLLTNISSKKAEFLQE